MSPPKVAILDYGCGNLGSVVNAVRKVGGEAWVSRTLLHDYTHIIMPGQGAYRNLDDGWRYVLNAWKSEGRPILGICLGMQLMCEGSEEAPGVKGLGWIPLQVRKIPAARLPHIGWNAVVWSDKSVHDYYFCHSYAVPGFVLDEAYQQHGFDSWGTAIVEGQALCAALRCGNLWAVQFHPEKSGQAGLALLAEFLQL